MRQQTHRCIDTGPINRRTHRVNTGVGSEGKLTPIKAANQHRIA